MKNQPERTEFVFIMMTQAGVGTINVDTLDELEAIQRIGSEYGVRVVSVRLRPSYRELSDSDPEFVTEYTSGGDSKFGVDIPSGQAWEACEKALAMRNVNLLRLHHHIGYTIYPPLPYTAANDLRRHEPSVREVMDFAGDLGKAALQA